MLPMRRGLGLEGLVGLASSTFRVEVEETNLVHTLYFGMSWFALHAPALVAARREWPESNDDRSREKMVMPVAKLKGSGKPIRIKEIRLMI